TDPPSLAGDQYYQASVTLEGTGSVYLDFWNGSQDLTSATVQLSGTPQTVTLQGQVPAGASTHFQIRTADSGPVDLYASAASILLLTPEQSGCPAARAWPGRPPWSPGPSLRVGCVINDADLAARLLALPAGGACRVFAFDGRSGAGKTTV